MAFQAPPTRTVLVCEDDPAMLRIFQFLLMQQGIQKVLTTASGEKVLAMLQADQPDLVLLDLMLPGRDGLDVLRDIKANEATKNIPVIVVSGKESQQQVQQAMMAGATDYVIKPFEPSDLGMRIRTFLDSMNG